MKCQDRTVERGKNVWNMQWDQWAPFPSAMEKEAFSRRAAVVGMVLRSYYPMSLTATHVSEVVQWNTMKRRLEEREHQRNTFWRAATDGPMPTKRICVRSIFAQEFPSNNVCQLFLTSHKDLPIALMCCMRNFCSMASHDFLILVINFHFITEETFLSVCWRATAKTQNCRNKGLEKILCQFVMEI